jgi:Uma2 family endonuclease
MAVTGQSDSRMTAEEFMAWYDTQPEGRRYELLGGIVYEMQRERARHNRVKTRITLSMQGQIDPKKLPCENYSDGMAVRVDAETVFEPDAMVRCGPRVPGDATLIQGPLIVVEILSPTTQHVDVFRKFNRYFNNPSLVHYLIINSIDANAVHHRRNEQGRIESRSHNGGVIQFDPPGLTLDLDQLFLDLD